MTKGIHSDDIVKKTLQYLNDEKEIKKLPKVKYILEVFPKSMIVDYRRKK